MSEMEFGVLYFLGMSLLIPGIMLLFGWVFARYPPKKISSMYGYRTRHSKQSQEAWDIAQPLFGRWFLGCGAVLLALVLLSFVLVGVPADPYGMLLWYLAAELVWMIVPVAAVELRLRRQFPIGNQGP